MAETIEDIRKDRDALAANLAASEQRIVELEDELRINEADLRRAENDLGNAQDDVQRLEDEAALTRTDLDAIVEALRQRDLDYVGVLLHRAGIEL